jgi:hypothetical protein
MPLPLCLALSLACSDSDSKIRDAGQNDPSSPGDRDAGGGAGGEPTDASSSDAGSTSSDAGGGSSVRQYPELWYSVVDQLVRIPLDPEDGTVLALEAYPMRGEIAAGHSAITMLGDGSLLLARTGPNSPFYHIAKLPRMQPGAEVTARALGTLPGDFLIEGLYTDCDGRVYAMDSGEDTSSAAGNRLLRFTGDLLAGDFALVVVSDLSKASVADIDDMGPAIVDNRIVDNPGLAIDSGTIYAFNYETGLGTEAGKGGSWGIHALGGSLFDDDVARLYILDSQAQLYRQNPTTFELSEVLIQGPQNAGQFRGWSGLAGPLTSCETGFTVI